MIRQSYKTVINELFERKESQKGKEKPKKLLGKKIIVMEDFPFRIL
jgi:hypothetical protein